MYDGDPNPAQEVAEDRVPPTPEPREPLWLLVAGITVFLGLLAISWYPALRAPKGTGSFTAAITARASTYFVAGRLYLGLRTDLHSSLRGLGKRSAVRADARKAAEEWEKLATQEDTGEAAGAHWMNAAGLYAAANDAGQATRALAAARRAYPANAAVYDDLRAHVGAHPAPVSPAARAAVSRTSAGPVWLAHAALARGDTSAAIAALEPAARAALRVLIVNGSIFIVAVAIVVTALVLLLIFLPQISATMARLAAPAPGVPWGLGMALTMIGTLFLAAQTLAGLLVQTLGITTPLARIAVGAGTEIVVALLLLAVFTALYGRRTLDLAVVGFRHVRRGWAYGLLTLLLTLPLVWIAAMISAALFHDTDGTHPIIPFLFSAHNIWEILGLSFTALVMAPLVEETFFRGILHPALEAHLRFWPAALVSGLLFSAIHGQLAALLPIGVLGVMLAFLMRRTQTLWAPIAAHAAFNGLSTAIALLTSWALHGPGS